jgi:hypothetical protein
MMISSTLESASSTVEDNSSRPDLLLFQALDEANMAEVNRLLDKYPVNKLIK